MSIPQQKFREIVLQCLYSLDLGKGSEEDLISFLMKELSVTKKTMRAVLERVQQVREKEKEIDPLIEKTSRSYAFERIQNIERNVLRLGIFELLYDHAIPPKVAIAEAIRLCRKFSTPESAYFVNAILDAIYKISQGQPIDAAQVTETRSTFKEDPNPEKKETDQR